MAGLALVLTGREGATPLTAGSASILLLGLGLFALNVPLNVRSASTTAP